MATKKAEEEKVEESSAKTYFTAHKGFTYGEQTVEEGKRFKLPDDWAVDKAENEHLQMQDKKTAAVREQEYKPWRTVFIQRIPVYAVDQRGRPTSEQTGFEARRIILPVT